MVKREKGQSLLEFPKNYTIIDIETTGLNHKFDSLLEFGAIKVRNEEIIEETSFLIKHIDNDYIIDDFIFKKTGINNDMIFSKGLHIDVAAYKIFDFLKNEVLIGHNVNFDLNFLYDFLKSTLNLTLSNDYVDTLRLSRRLIKNTEDHKLDTLINYFKIEPRTLHRSLSDCLLTKDLLNNLLNEYKKYDPELLLNSRKLYSKVKANDISPNSTDFDIDNPFYESYVCFTGKLQDLIRTEANQLIADLGGAPQDNITKKTNYLVIGDLNYSQNIKNGITGKMKKATMLNKNGQDIKILAESTFINLLADYDIKH